MPYITPADTTRPLWRGRLRTSSIDQNIKRLGKIQIQSHTSMEPGMITIMELTMQEKHFKKKLSSTSVSEFLGNTTRPNVDRAPAHTPRLLLARTETKFALFCSIRGLLGIPTLYPQLEEYHGCIPLEL